MSNYVHFNLHFDLLLVELHFCIRLEVRWIKLHCCHSSIQRILGVNGMIVTSPCSSIIRVDKNTFIYQINFLCSSNIDDT